MAAAVSRRRVVVVNSRALGWLPAPYAIEVVGAEKRAGRVVDGDALVAVVDLV